MSKKKNQISDSGIDNVEFALSKTEQFIEDNQNAFLIVLAAEGAEIIEEGKR